MTDTTITEATRMLAEKVMMQYKWGQVNGKSYLYSLETGEPHQEFIPFTDERHALQVLTEWCPNNTNKSWNIEHVEDNVHVTLYEAKASIIGWSAIVNSESQNLCHAICLALLEAVTGVKYTIKEDEL